jgi:hypothetical protein
MAQRRGIGVTGFHAQPVCDRYPGVAGEHLFCSFIFRYQVPRLNHVRKLVLLFQKLAQKEIFSFRPIAIVVLLSLPVFEFLEHLRKQNGIGLETLDPDVGTIDNRLSACIEYLALYAARFQAQTRFYPTIKNFVERP